MDFDKITKILEMMREHHLIEFELESDNVKLRLKKAQENAPAETVRPVVETGTAPGGEAGSASEIKPTDDSLVEVSSPIVGTFYSSSEPGATAFTAVGETVAKGQVLCIIEAMKLMNEINVDVDGVVVEVHVENGQAVQFGDRLFSIKPD
jgi:acetyl-CoA carboxylase biotin carboxyl carrier protein